MGMVLAVVGGASFLGYLVWLIISAVAPVPSILTSTIGGDALGMGNYIFAVFVFILTGVISGLGLLIYRRVCQKKERSQS